MIFIDEFFEEQEQSKQPQQKSFLTDEQRKRLDKRRAQLKAKGLKVI